MLRRSSTCPCNAQSMPRFPHATSTSTLLLCWTYIYIYDSEILPHCFIHSPQHPIPQEEAILMKSCICSPPWEVLLLVAHYLDPKALAISSCVSRSWSISMSSDHLWQPICSAHFPSLCNLRAADPTVPYRRLYAIGYVSVKRRLRSPSKPRLSLDDVVFAIDVQCRDSGIVTIAKPASDLEPDPNGLFRFDMEVCEPPRMAKVLAGVRVMWSVVLKGWQGVFSMMECKRKGSFVPDVEGWFSSELPAPVCCSGRVGSGLVADLRLGFCGAEDGRGGRVRVGKVGVGVLSVVSWRYVSVDDALRYLQHFLSPSHD